MENSGASVNVLPVILAGGSGTRLWPLSRELYPKQFQALVGNGTLLGNTLARLDTLCCDDPVVVCNQVHRFLVAEQCRAQGVPSTVLLEPVPRNTAPAIALAAMRALRDGEDPVLLVLPADHHICAVDAFRSAVRQALPFAARGGLVVFGVAPTRPESRYGYIQVGDPVSGDGSVARVTAFKEKPAPEVAARYLAEGGWLWNSGMFVLRASVFVEELGAQRPDILEACAGAVAGERPDLDFHRPGDAFHDCPAESVDRAVMEGTKKAVVVRAGFDWSDVGAWDALSDALEGDRDGNRAVGDVIATDSRNCCFHSSGRLIAAIGVERLVVVETPDAVLVVPRDRAQDVAKTVERLRDTERTEHRAHTTDYRPWGQAQTLGAGEGFLVKRITVAAGKALSLQMHRHRSEHWVVLHGEATVVRGDAEFSLRSNESTYIPVGTRHRLTNQGTEPLVLIEVQTGTHLSEQDIVRFEDLYGRA